jgi:P-type E1-E2 ATPase
MLTGDGEKAARTVCHELDVNRYYAQVLPKDKADIIEALKREGRRVVMVGDGINDSPALAAADVSVAMKDSSDIAREVADITMLSSDLAQLVKIRILSQRLMRRIRRNFNWIIAINTALLAAGIGNVIAPGATAFLHNASTLTIGVSALRPYLTDKTGDPA